MGADEQVRRFKDQLNAAIKKKQLDEEYRLIYGRSRPVDEQWVDDTVWDNAAPYKASRPNHNHEYGPVELKINANSFTNPKVTSQVMAQPPAKKYRASIMVETNDLDRGSVTVQRLLSVDLAADDFENLVKAAHGALDLAKDN